MVAVVKKSGYQKFFRGVLEKGYRFMRWRRLPLILMVLAVVCGVATYVGLTKKSYDVGTIYWLLNIDLVVLLSLGALVARQAVKLWVRRKQGIAGSKLHVRLVFVFSLLTATPAIMMAVFSSFFFYFGIQAWFNDRVSTAVNESLNVAQAYLQEHQQVMKADVLAMANDLNREAPYLVENPKAFQQIIRTQSQLRNLSEAIVFSSSGKVLARSYLTFTLEFEPIPETHLDKARAGEVVLLSGGASDRIRALVKLDRFVDAYLFVGRLVDGTVLSHMKTVEDAVDEYTALEGRRGSLQISVTLMFLAVALLLLLVAVWFGLLFARHLANPISDLIGAAEKVRGGDMSARVKETGQDDELGTLAVAFNRMTSQLETQRQELMQANRMLNERRRFTEAVLSGASSGIVGLDHDGRISLANIVFADLLGVDDAESLTEQKLVDLIEEVKPLIEMAYTSPKRQSQAQMDYLDKDGRMRSLLVRITVEKGDLETGGAVVTFDDVSELVSAQRKAAWSDVARRIAHEIKNPLTPIQLSAERLKRKYTKQITTDADAFEKCTDTIIRQVSEIGRMVGEFASFARMPEAVKVDTDIVDLGQEVFNLHQQAYPDIEFQFKSNRKKQMVYCDRGQIVQVVTNLLQNAADSVQEYMAEEQGKDTMGEVSLNLKIDKKHNVVKLEVEDNGKGLPQDDIERLTEPYVTTKKKGTGLGLAIVKKILEDHGGMITLENRSVFSDNKERQHGARVVMTLPLGQSGLEK